MKMSNSELLTQEIKAIIERKNKETLEEIKEFLQALNERPIISEIPKEALTLDAVDMHIRKYNLNSRVLQGKQTIPMELRTFTIVAIIVRVLATRDVDNNRPEKLRLKNRKGSHGINLNNWNGSPDKLLKDLKGKTIIFYNVNLSAVKHEFRNVDGDWILHWDGDYKILKELK
ncbi:MAG: hypothetical protein ACTSWZ_05865 [Candidatus Heimdallarchaeaceae archaeon]